MLKMSYLHESHAIAETKFSLSNTSSMIDPHPMDILIIDLHKDAAAIRQQLFSNMQTVTQVSEVGMDTEWSHVSR